MLTKYPLSIPFDKMQNSNKNNLKIISKLHAHLQTMTKAPVKFQKDRQKNCRMSCIHKVPTVRGGHNHGTTESRMLRPLAFLRKGGGQQISCGMTAIRTLDKHHSQRPLELSYLQGQHAEPKASFQPGKRVLG